MMIFLELFLTFFKIGAFTFGGGYAMLPLIQREIADKGWLSQEKLVDFIAVAESTPGPFAINAATYVGMETARLFGAVCATLGVVVPSFAVILIVAKCFKKFKESFAVKGIMSGLKPCTVGLIAAAVVSIGKTAFFPESPAITPLMFASVGIFLVMAVLAFKKLNPIIIIVLSAVSGIAVNLLI